MMSLVKPCQSVPMAAFALQGTHLVAGSGCRQVCDVFPMSLANPGYWVSYGCFCFAVQGRLL